MKIKWLHIHAFGQFYNKTIVFEDGINVIYGPNEAGKSTVHKFIEVMFYGFFKPYTKKRVYDHAYEAFRPWSGEGYGGSLVLEESGQMIRLERLFTKGKDELRIYDQVTGEEITDKYDYNKVTRQVEPGRVHFGQNLVAYRNTVSLAQMASLTEAEMAMEIKEHLSNMTGGQGQISVDTVLRKINHEKGLIGSERKSSSPYARARGLIDGLKDELLEARAVHAAIHAEQLREHRLAEELEALEEQAKDTEKDLSYLERCLAGEKRAQLEALESERKKLGDILNHHQPHKDFTVEAAEELRKLHQAYEQNKTCVDRLTDELSILESRVTRLESESNERTGGGELACARAYEAVCQAVSIYEEKDEERKDLEQTLVALQSAANGASEPGSLSGMDFALAVSGLLFLVALTGAVLYQPVMWWGVAVTGGFAVGAALLHRRRRIGSAVYESEREAAEHQRKIVEQSLEEVQRTLNDLLEPFQIHSLAELIEEKERLRAEKELLVVREEEREKIRKALMIDRGLLADQNQALKACRSALEAATFEWEKGLKAWNMATEQEISSGLQSHMIWQQTREQLNSIENSIKALLGGKTPEEIKQATMSMERTVNTMDVSEIKDQLEDVRRKQVAINQAISASVSKQATLKLSAREPVVIEEEMAEAAQKLESLDHQLAVYSLVSKTIEAIAVDIQNDFAPGLNASVSNMVKQITDGRYRDIKVNPDMELTVYDEQLHRTVPADALSAGTIDSFYLALRLGISEMLTPGKKLPLIMDDPFVQYDSSRMANGIDMIGHLDRQVLLFTCHERESAYMEKKHVPHKRVLIKKK